MSTATTAPETGAGEGAGEATTARALYDQGVRLAALKKHADAAESFSKCLELLRAEAHKPAPGGDDAAAGAGAGAASEAQDKAGVEADATDAAKDDEEDDPKLAPVLHKYGRELLNHAILGSSAVGGGGAAGAGAGGAGKGGTALPSKVTLPSQGGSTSQAAPAAAAGAGSSTDAGASTNASKKGFSFSGDTEEFDEDDEDDDDEEGGGDGEEEENDFDVAFAALDVARRLYERALAESSTLETIDGTTLSPVEISRQLGNVLTDLGELQLECEYFDSATTYFQSALDVLSSEQVTDPKAFSRRLAEAHFQLGLALEYHPETERRGAALEHIQTTHRLVTERKAALIARRDSDEPPLPITAPGAQAGSNGTDNGKGKGKGSDASVPLAADDVRTLSKEQATKEIAQVDELLQDLEAKIEELQSSLANGNASSGPAYDAVKKAIDEAFLGKPIAGAATSTSAKAAPANDLTTLVKKKKKAPAEATPVGGEKRKAEEVDASTSTASGGVAAGSGSASGSKKARVDDAVPGEE